MRTLKFLALLVVAALLFAGSALADSTLFYAGDFDPNNPNANGLANETDALVSGVPYGSATYQNFIVSGTWNITGLFTNNLSNLNPSTAYWEIRSGVSEGNGGTLLYSGTSAVIQTATGRSGFGFDEYTDLVTGLNITLGPGQYWFAVVPEDPNNQNRSFNDGTFGLNAIGVEVDNQQFWNSSFFGVNFTNANNGGAFPAFSGGIIGNTGQVPEPSSLLLLGTGLMSVAGAVRRKIVR